MTYDIRGNVLSVTDALGREAFRYVYDLANRRLRLDSIDAGVRRTVVDAASNVTEQRDSKGALILHVYDTLNRPTRLWTRDAAGSQPTLRERLEYGDGSSPTQADTEREVHRQANHLGKLYRHYDEAGLLTVEQYDFKGNVMEKVRRVISDAKILEVFTPPPPNWHVTAFRVNWQPPVGTTFENHLAGILDPKEYRTSIQYNARNRIKTARYPQDVANQRQELRLHYNRAGALERITLDDTTYVERIAYNAKGQRTLIAYGNGVMTVYAYDPETFRLAWLWSGNYSKPVGSELTYHPTLPHQPLQDLAYTYDLVGNIARIDERTPGCGVQNTLLGNNALDRLFTYDALYRLRSATGRESRNISHPRPWTDDQRYGFNSGNHGTPNQGNAPNLTRRYTEEYLYDPAGNLVLLRHRVSNNTWTRHFGMGGLTPQQWQQEWHAHFNTPLGWENTLSNRLTHIGDNQTVFSQTHDYDANGNLRRETTTRHFVWDQSDRMKAFRTQAGNSEPTVHAQYLYDASGQRLKKLVRTQGGRISVTVYIDSIFEYQGIVQGSSSSTRENNTLHVMDNQSRIALVRVGNPFPDDTTPAVKYDLGDHLGSSNIVVDDVGSWVNREEYTPYGETSFGSFARKRYRFSGKERDAENDLLYFGARYFAPWMGRWMNSDPLLGTDTNAYTYVKGNPIRLTDPRGMAPRESDMPDYPPMRPVGAGQENNMDGTRGSDAKSANSEKQGTPPHQKAPEGQNEAPPSANGATRGKRTIEQQQDPVYRGGPQPDTGTPSKPPVDSTLPPRVTPRRDPHPPDGGGWWKWWLLAGAAALILAAVVAPEMGTAAAAPAATAAAAPAAAVTAPPPPPPNAPRRIIDLPGIQQATDIESARRAFSEAERIGLKLKIGVATPAEMRASKHYLEVLQETRNWAEAGKKFHDEVGAQPSGPDRYFFGSVNEVKTKNPFGMVSGEDMLKAIKQAEGYTSKGPPTVTFFEIGSGNKYIISR
jgi:RHS repeat-associated protein